MKTKLAPGLLLASPHLNDPNFDKTVVFLFEHSAEGTLGVVVNRTWDVPLRQVLEDMKIPTELPLSEPVHYGGPVATDVGWMIHSTDYQEQTTRQVAEGVAISMSQDVLVAIAAGEGPRHRILCIGHSGWGPRQLEFELEQNAWLTAPPDFATLFETPVEERWQRAYQKLGIVAPLQFAPTSGNA